MDTQNTTKFSFETEFAPDGTILRDDTGWRMTFTQEEMQVERDKAYAEGQRDALVQAEQASAALLSELNEHSTQILSTLKEQANQCRCQAIELVLVAARKIAGRALECFPDEQVKDTVQEILKDLRGAPRLVVTCPSGVSDKLSKDLQEMAAHSAFDGELIIRQSEAAAPGDVRLEWAQGEVDINTEDVARRVENTVRQWLAATEEQEEQPDLFASDTGTKEEA
ncbi:MAG: FliH/SctL family protein [Robiginitomaculum sp.]|nr:FliH/SctL family protein [Robiginitomaculum sp.]MDQ7076549.1 FliH/SctL family protein [Robiginitomaculum sp.]